MPFCLGPPTPARQSGLRDSRLAWTVSSGDESCGLIPAVFRPIEAFVGLRYLRARRRNQYISFISAISLAGIAVGVASLIIVLSIMNGFGNELRARLLSLTAHITVSSDLGIDTPQQVVDSLRAHPQVTGATVFADGQGLLINGLNLSGVQIRGMDRDGIQSSLGDAVDPLIVNELATAARKMIMGAELARSLGVLAGDDVTVMIPRADAAGTLSPLLRRFTVAGIFELGIAEHDSATIIVHIDDAATLFGLSAGHVKGIRASVTDIFSAPQIRRELAAELGDQLEVSDWTREQASIYRATRIEKVMMFVILMLIVAVAAFNIVATLVMVVSDKRNDIAILRTLGMRPSQVLRIFIVQGGMIGLTGTALGLLGGVTVALNIETLIPRLEQKLGFSLLPRDVYYITSVPSDLRWSEVALIVAVTLALSVLSTLYPARRAAATHPAEALRYE